MKKINKWIATIGIFAICLAGCLGVMNINSTSVPGASDEAKQATEVLGLGMQKVSENEYDATQIPDKYNTGCSSTGLSKVEGSGFSIIDDVEYRISTDTVKIDFDNTHFDWSKYQTITIRNKDFSNITFRT